MSAPTLSQKIEALEAKIERYEEMLAAAETTEDKRLLLQVIAESRRNLHDLHLQLQAEARAAATAGKCIYFILVYIIFSDFSILLLQMFYSSPLLLYLFAQLQPPVARLQVCDIFNVYICNETNTVVSILPIYPSLHFYLIIRTLNLFPLPCPSIISPPHLIYIAYSLHCFH